MGSAAFAKRLTMPPLNIKQRRERRSAQLRAEVAQTIAEGRMSVRQMTPEERVESDRRRELIQASRARQRQGR